MSTGQTFEGLPCARCRQLLRLEAADADLWSAVRKTGQAVGVLCPDCQATRCPEWCTEHLYGDDGPARFVVHMHSVEVDGVEVTIERADVEGAPGSVGLRLPDYEAGLVPNDQIGSLGGALFKAMALASPEQAAEGLLAAMG